MGYGLWVMGCVSPDSGRRPCWRLTCIQPLPGFLTAGRACHRTAKAAEKVNQYFCNMKSFDVPIIYRSPLISAIKKKRKEMDRMKKNFHPTLLDFGPLKIYLARHFGFCYGVENAIEIAFRTIDGNPGKNIFLLSEMIHNPQVNADLESNGVRFLQDTYGNQLIPFETIKAGDIVLIPAFGTTLEMENKLRQAGIQTEAYNTTCPFVEKVWN